MSVSRGNATSRESVEGTFSSPAMVSLHPFLKQVAFNDVSDREDQMTSPGMRRESRLAWHPRADGLGSADEDARPWTSIFRARFESRANDQPRRDSHQPSSR